MNAIGSLQCIRPGFRQTKEPNLTLLDQFRHRADNFFNWNCWVDPMLIKQVNHIDTEPFERTFNRRSNFLGMTIDIVRRSTFNFETKLGGNDCSISASLQSL